MSRVVQALTAAAYLVLVTRAVTLPHGGLALTFGLLYVLLTAIGFGWVARRRLPWRIGYLLIATPVVFAGFGSATDAVGSVLLIVTLVIQATLLLPLPLAALIALATPFLHVGMSWDAGWREGLGVLGAAAFALVVTWLLQREQSARSQLQAANEQLAEFAAQAEQLATTRERNRVARDIHDGLGHHLTVIGMQLQAARAVRDADPDRADEVLAKAEDQARQALAEIRRSVRVLREPRRGSLVDAVGSLAADVGFEVVGEPRPLADEVEETIYRVVQEGLTNVRKHAPGRSARVRLDYRDAEVVTTITNDADSDGPAGSDGYGLRGLRERLTQANGTLEFTRDATGATLRAEVPA